MADWRTEFQYLLDRKILSRDELGYLFGQIKSIINAENHKLQAELERLQTENEQHQDFIESLQYDIEQLKQAKGK